MLKIKVNIKTMPQITPQVIPQITPQVTSQIILQLQVFRYNYSLMVIFYLSTLFLLACDTTLIDSKSETKVFDEVPIGCYVQRISEQNWKQICPLDLSITKRDSYSINASDFYLDIDYTVNAYDFDELDQSTRDQSTRDQSLIDMQFFDQELHNDLSVEEEIDQFPSPSLPCDPPLSLTSRSQASLPYNLMPLQANGGSGHWHFEIVENQSESIINELTGVYVAGSHTGVEDLIRVTDSYCDGESDLRITIVNPMNFKPQSPQIPPQSNLVFQVEGGSGHYRLTFTEKITDADIQGLTYSAGLTIGQDLLTLTDLHTQESHNISVQVANNLSIQPEVNNLYIPLNSQIDLKVTGGSKYYQLATQNILSTTQVQNQENGQIITIQANQLGRYQIELQDKFTSLTSVLNVQVAPSLQAVAYPHNDHQYTMQIQSQHDLNQDGVRDFVVAHSYADIEAHNGGALLFYLSEVSEEGKIHYQSQAQQIMSGTQRLEQMGSDFIIQDINGDDSLDIVYGISGLDLGETDSGAFKIHTINAQGEVIMEAHKTFGGPQNDAQLGFQVASCDFNGDGILDLISSAYAYEDREADPIAWNQGALLVYLGQEGNYFSVPDQVIKGVWLDEQGQWQNTASLHLGFQIATGDFNGDQLCDVAVSSISWAHQNQGQVMIYSGQAIQSDAFTLGGLSRTPRILIQSDEFHQNGRLGYRLISQDIDQDGYDDLLVSHIESDFNQQTNTGAIYVYYGGANEESNHFDALDYHEDTEDTEDAPQVLHTNDADLTLIGEAWDLLGIDVDIMRWRQKSYLVSTELYGDADQGWDAGCILMHALYDHEVGERLDPHVFNAPYLKLCGPSQQFQLGQAVSDLGDLNQDGFPEFIISSNRLGSGYTHVGRLFLASSDVNRISIDIHEVDEEWIMSTTAIIDAQQHNTLSGQEGQEQEQGEQGLLEVPYILLPLNIPLQVAGIEFGTGVALLGDINDDGQEDALITSPRSTHPLGTSSEGSLWFYDQIESVWTMLNQSITQNVSEELSSSSELFGSLVPLFEGHSAWDLLQKVQSAGDFNADGYLDIAVLMSHDERMSNPDETWIIAETCEAAAWDQGGLYIFLGGPQFDWHPDFVYWGHAGDQATSLSGGYDYNGDLYDDILIGAVAHDHDGLSDVGRVVMIQGRAQNYEGQIEVICEPSFDYHGIHARDYVGSQVRGMRDLNGDGCDEMAIGIQLDQSQGLINQGGALIVFGHGQTSCGYSAYGIKLNRGRAYEQMGASLSTGDFTGDGFDDLALGAPYTYYEGAIVGSSWIVPASFLRSQSPILLSQMGDFSSVWLDSLIADRWSIYGHVAWGESGRNVQIIPANEYHSASLVIQTLKDSMAGETQVSTLRFYTPASTDITNTVDHINEQAIAMMAGETQRSGSGLGYNFSLSPTHHSYMLVSAPKGNGVGLDAGSVYLLDLSLLGLHD
jgi:hypothetical protein